LANVSRVLFSVIRRITQASTISELYKQRWMIEIFFKELKSHLKIKSFIGTNENAMWIQIWTASITLLLLRYLKELANYNWSLSNMIAFLRMNLFVKIVLKQWLINQSSWTILLIQKLTYRIIHYKKAYLLRGYIFVIIKICPLQLILSIILFSFVYFGQQ